MSYSHVSLSFNLALDQVTFGVYFFILFSSVRNQKLFYLSRNREAYRFGVREIVDCFCCLVSVGLTLTPPYLPPLFSNTSRFIIPGGLGPIIAKVLGDFVTSRVPLDTKQRS